jgi:predicted metallopeptidase
MKETEQLGCCYALETIREFIIEVEKSLYKKDLDDFIKTICHEMVHVWQTASKAMKDSYDGQKFWKGKNGKYKNYTNTIYNHQPWEHQAYSMQDKLLEQFKEYYYGNK